MTARPSKPSCSRSTPVTTSRDIEEGTRGSIDLTSMWPTITAGTPASTAAAKGARSTAASCLRVRVCTGSVRWLSCGTEPCPGKCLSTGTTAACSIPSTAAATWVPTTSGSEPADRDPMVGSPGPEVTSASGANTTSKPRPRSSAALARWAAAVTCGSPAAPADMKVGKRVASPLTRSTMPPSWSTDRKSGHGRRTARSRVALTDRIWPVDATLSEKAITPPRCSWRTICTGAAVPRHSATITCPARSGSDIRPTSRAARSSSACVGPQPSTRPRRSAGVGGVGAAAVGSPAGVAGSSAAGSPLHAEAVSPSASTRGRTRRSIPAVFQPGRCASNPSGLRLALRQSSASRCVS